VATSLNEELLDERLAKLEMARSWSPRLVSKLESYVRSADDEALFRINPFTLARERNLPEDEVIDLLLNATSLGLFGMDWLLVCPKCACVVESLSSLKELHHHYHCSMCQVGYEAALDDYIAVTFTVSPEIRAIPFHHPEQLSALDYCFKYGATRDGVLPNGTPFVNVKVALTKVASYLPPNETTRLTIEASEGTILGASPEGRASLLFSVKGTPSASTQIAHVLYDKQVREHAPGSVAPGPITFEVENATAKRGTFFLAVLPPGVEVGKAPISFLPFLTGKRLLTTQAFRDLFRSEVIQASEGIGVREITLLFTDLKGSTALYDRIGDLNAFSLVQQHFERLQDVTARCHGAIIKTIGDAVMAAFLNPADAVAAALAMRAEIAGFNRRQPDRQLILKIGIHTGAAIAVTLNERLDYFGQTVNIASRVQHLADADEIYVSESAYEDAGVKAAVEPFRVESRIAKLRGVQQDLRVYCIAAPALQEGISAPAGG
jgi:class 3 adenylate cyclase